jgi:ABC-2 type transport system ATP-binding protein
MPRESPALSMIAASRTFASSTGPVRAVHDLHLTIERGQVVGVLGPNGAGKTTSVKMAATLLEPTSGSVHVMGVDAVARPREARRHIGLVLGGDRGFYMRASARENLAFFAELQGVRSRRSTRVDDALHAVGLTAHGPSRVETFSRGMKQRLHVARALLADPGLVLLDEPSIGLDPAGAHDLRRLVEGLRRDGRGVLLTTHYLTEAEELADTLVVVADGTVVARGSTADIAKQAGVGTVTTVTSHGVRDPRELLHGMANIADLTTSYRNGVWSLSVVWGDERPDVDRLHHALDGHAVLSTVMRDTSLEEAYLAFLHRRTHADGVSSP